MSALINENWDKIKETVRDEYNLSSISYNTWIRDLSLLKVEDHIVTIMIPSDQSHSLNYISNRYKDYFRIIISEMMEEEYDVEFTLQKNTAPSSQDSSDTVSSNINITSANLNPKYRFNNFIVGSNNKFAHNACLAVAESPGDSFNPLFIYGGAGLGKTHLMHSIGHYILQYNSDMKVLYVTSETFTNEVIDALKGGVASSMTRLREKYRNVDVLLIDDIQFIIGKEATQNEFFHTFNELYAAGKQIVLSSDRPPKEMETLEDRFRSRFEWGLIADIQVPDYETRMAILRKNASQCPNPINDDILKYIATNIKSNIRELEGALNKIIAYSRLNNVEINLENTKEALKDYIYPDIPQTLTPNLIAITVCEHYGVKLSSIASKKKSAECVIPRQIIMYLCREYTDATLNQIAALLGKKDHSTVMYGVDRIREDLKTNEDIRSNINIILKKLNLQE